MSTHSSTLAWEIPWREDLAGKSPWGCKESDTPARLTFTFTFSKEENLLQHIYKESEKKRGNQKLLGFVTHILCSCMPYISGTYFPKMTLPERYGDNNVITKKKYWTCH